MAKAPIGDTIARALETIDKLQDTVIKHAEILETLATKVAELEKRAAGSTKASNP